FLSTISPRGISFRRFSAQARSSTVLRIGRGGRGYGLLEARASSGVQLPEPIGEYPLVQGSAKTSSSYSPHREFTSAPAFNKLLICSRFSENAASIRCWFCASASADALRSSASAITPRTKPSASARAALAVQGGFVDIESPVFFAATFVAR